MSSELAQLEQAQLEQAQLAKVLAIVSDPGEPEQLAITLQSLADQQYLELTTVVLADSQAPDRKGTPAPNYTTAVNNICAANPDAHYLLLLRDGVVLAPDALSTLVADANESGAGVVGPKLLDINQPERLADVGGTVDQLGEPTSAAAVGELDQSQYDSAREAFVAPAGVMLIQAQAFKEIGGFDPVMDASGAHVDICWRVQMSARRVRVVPTAVAYQLVDAGTTTGTADTSPVDTGPTTSPAPKRAKFSAPTANLNRRILYSHRIRTFAKCYGWVHLIPAISLAAIVGLVQLIYALARGRFSLAGDIAAAWLWNLRHSWSLLRLRRQTQRRRVLRDATLRQLHTVSTRRVEDWVGSWFSSAAALTESVRGPGGILSTDKLNQIKVNLVVWPVTLAVLGFGGRHLITRGVASFGQFADFASTDLLFEAFWGGWREVGAGAAGIGSTALGLLGVGSLATFGAVSTLRHLLILGLLPLGLLGIWRLTRMVGPAKSRLLAVILYACNPLPFAALAAGAWDVLLLYGTVPFIVSSIIALANPSLAGPSLAGPSLASPSKNLSEYRPSEHRRSKRLARAARLGLLLGVIAAFEPLVLLLSVLIALLLALVGALHRRRGYATAVALWSLVAVAFAGLLNLLWIMEFGSVVDFFEAALDDPTIAEPHSLADLLRFEIGGAQGIQVAWLGWGLLVATVAAVMVAVGRRAFWAFSGLALAMAGFGLAWVAEQGWLDTVTTASSLGLLSLVLAVVGCCWTVAVGTAGLKPVGLADDDLTAAGIGMRMRRATLVVVAIAVSAALLPTLLATRSGDWEVAEFDLEIPLASIDDREVGPSYRVLWVGQPEVLPLASRALQPAGSQQPGSQQPGSQQADLHIATSVRGYPDIRSYWPGPITPAEQRLHEAVSVGLSGETLRMGRLLGSFGIRYVVVVDRSTPSYARGWDRPTSAVALDALESQIDLLPVATDTAVHVFRNEAWWSSRSQFIPPIEPGQMDSQQELIVTDLTRGVGVLADNRSVTDQRGQIGAGQVVVTESFDSNWRLETSAGTTPPRSALGWAMSFESPTEGSAQLRYHRPSNVLSATVAQMLIWAMVLWLALGQPTLFLDRAPTRPAKQQ